MTDYEKFYAAMKMLRDNGVVSGIDVDTVGANDDTIVRVKKGGVEILEVVFCDDGDFDREVF